MTYDERLAARVRSHLARTPGVRERRMFGGLCFLLNGNMCCGIVRDTLMVRVGSDAYADALRQPHAREMDFTGRPLRGMVYVAPAGLATDAALSAWVTRARAFALTLPPKTASPSARAERRGRPVKKTGAGKGSRRR